MAEMMDDVEGGEACPAATGDLTLNLRNRGRAIDKADYGPMNPNEPNDQYWQRMAARWDVPADEARTMRCGNCGAFNQTSRMLACIENGLSDDRNEDAMEVVEAGDLGFCEIFDFKCAAARTCSAWIVGGPIKDEGDEEGEEEYEEEGGEEYGEAEGGSSEDMSAEEEE
jgi:hypothetical protein